MNNNETLVNNELAYRYEVHIDGYLAKIDYQKNGGQIFLNHTEVPIELEGKGIGSKLVTLVLNDIDQQGLKLIPFCPFVKKYIQKHPEWKRILVRQS
ncbi:MAG TPA: GNAT family N-acetyltransferase [Sunxiuqinia sp.]|nr:GNAT family N-acetyltransferase [Sunxiuqinia sp.]